MTDETASRRRGGAEAQRLEEAAAAPALAASPRADAVPARDSRKEDARTRTAARYKADSAHVQAFYRTNRYEQ